MTGLAGCFHAEDPDDPAAPGDDDEDPLDGNESEDGDEPEDGEDGDVGEWEGVNEIHLEGETEAWLGVEPGPIDGEENPTLVLFEGQDYTISFENIDGAQHNLVLRDDSGEVVEDYETDMTEEEGDEASLDFEATAELAEYICQPHEDTMHGEIQIEEDGETEDGEEDGMEDDEENGTENGTEDDEDDGTENTTDEE